MAEAQADTFNWFDRAFVHLTTFLKHIITPINMWLLKVSKGRFGNTFLGTSVLLLHSVGCKSGLERVTPLFYLEHDEKIILVASNGGNIKNPAWVNNLNANPEAKVNIKGTEIKMHARIANSEEHEFYWPKATEFFSTWEWAQEKSIRKFPIIVLEPR